FLYYEYTPKYYSKTMVIGTGMHGGEKLAIISLYNYLKLLIESWREYPQLAYDRHNVRLVIMPIQNPSGVYANSRRNILNNVDINRNFPDNWSSYPSNPGGSDYKGASAGSEWETQKIMEVLSKYSDAICYLDLHNMSAGDRAFSESAYSPSSASFPSYDTRRLMYKINPSRTMQAHDILSFDATTGFNQAAKTKGLKLY